MSEPAQTVDGFLASLAAERRVAIVAARGAILAHLAPGFRERMQYGMIGYGVPFSASAAPDAPLLSIAALADHGRYAALYLNFVGPERDAEEAFYARWRATGTPLETGSRAVRFRHVGELALELIGAQVARATPEQLRDAYARATSAQTGTGRPAPGA